MNTPPSYQQDCYFTSLMPCTPGFFLFLFQLNICLVLHVTNASQFSECSLRQNLELFLEWNPSQCTTAISISLSILYSIVALDMRPLIRISLQNFNFGLGFEVDSRHINIFKVSYLAFLYQIKYSRVFPNMSCSSEQ